METATNMTSSVGNYSLTGSEVKFFHENGYLPKFEVFQPENSTICDEIALCLTNESKYPCTWGAGMCKYTQSRHLDVKAVWDLCRKPQIVDRMASLLGEDLVLWRTNLWNKKESDKRASNVIPWHQDWFYWSLEPQLSITAWVAIDNSCKENGCVQIIPGSHRTPLGHGPVKGALFKNGINESSFDADKAIYMELKKGEAFMFNERMIHGSGFNLTSKRRLGVAIRVTVPFVRVTPEEDFVYHPMVLLSGKDKFGFNEYCLPPRF